MMRAGSDTLMFREAGEAGSVVAAQASLGRDGIEALGAKLRALGPRAVITCARGSSDHAATFAKYLIETRAGVITASAAPSVSSVYRSESSLDQTLCIAISQSGKSPDLISTARAARDGGAFVVAFVNDPASPLADVAHHVVPLCAGAELSVAATKSYIGSLAALLRAVSSWTQDAGLARAVDDLPGLLGQAWQLDWSAMVDALADAANLYVIGRGIGLGVAQEAALKLKETCGLHAEAFSAAEVRHGPMALVKPGFPVILFRQSDETEAGIDELVVDLAGRGAKLLVAGAAPAGSTCLPTIPAHPAIEPLLQIQSFYRAANALSLARGYDPDKPPHLAKVTETV